MNLLKEMLVTIIIFFFLKSKECFVVTIDLIIIYRKIILCPVVKTYKTSNGL